MALGTNYRRNVGLEDSAASKRMAKARELSKELGGDLGLASSVVLGRMTMDEAKMKASGQ